MIGLIFKHPPDHSGVYFAAIVGLVWILIALAGSWYAHRRQDRNTPKAGN